MNSSDTLRSGSQATRSFSACSLSMTKCTAAGRGPHALRVPQRGHGGQVEVIDEDDDHPAAVVPLRLHPAGGGPAFADGPRTRASLRYSRLSRISANPDREDDQDQPGAKVNFTTAKITTTIEVSTRTRSR